MTALSRMNPNFLSMLMCDLYPKTGTAIIGSGVPSGRYRTLPPSFRVQRAFVSFCAALLGSSGQISRAVLPSLIACFSSSVLRCFGPAMTAPRTAGSPGTAVPSR